MNTKWILFGVALLVLLVVDWSAGGLGPRLVYGTGTLDLDSTPSGATVVLNGAAVGVTPIKGARVRPGDVVVNFEHPYHASVLQRLSLGRGDHELVHVAFAPATGALRVASNPRGARVVLDGVELETATPVNIDDISTGEHRIEVSIYGRETKSVTFDVLPDTLSEQIFELNRVPMGALSLQLTPSDATVEVLGIASTYTAGIELPVGTYRARVEAPGYATREVEVKVRQGKNLVNVALSRVYGRLGLILRPSHASVTVAYKDQGQVRSGPYIDQMQIPAGPFTVRATAMRHRNLERNLTMTGSGVNLDLAMKRFNVDEGRKFRDAMASGGVGPELIIIGPGTFRMGSATGAPDEKPVHQVSVTQPFAIGVYETTHAEFKRYDDWRGEADRPVTNVTVRDVRGYLNFLSRETGYRYRLPSEVEWEYAARADSVASYFFGDDMQTLCTYGNVADAVMKERFRKYTTADCTDGYVGLAPVGSFQPNAFGLYDVIGNAEEWVEDCWHSSYVGAPSSARIWGANCDSSRVVRGGAFDSPPDELRVAFRNMGASASDSRGFRVVREL